jgi:hypothetical protein
LRVQNNELKYIINNEEKFMSIFDDQNKVSAGWWNYAKLGVGAQVEGTYVGVKQVPSNFGGMQNIYELLLADGSTVLVPSKNLIDDQMKAVKLGQIVGFKYTHDKPNKRAGMKPTQFVQVYANPQIVNEKWLQDQEEVAAVAATFNEEDHSEVKTVIPAEENMPFLTDLEKIEGLAIKKLGATKENFQEAVMKETGIAMITENYADIINALSALADK